MNHDLICHACGNLTCTAEAPAGSSEQRSDILAELRQTVDSLITTCDRHSNARANIDKLLDMLKPGAETNSLRVQINRDIEKLDAVVKFHTFVLEQVRSGSLKRLAELFEL